MSHTWSDRWHASVAMRFGRDGSYLIPSSRLAQFPDWSFKPRKNSEFTPVLEIAFNLTNLPNLENFLPMPMPVTLKQSAFIKAWHITYARASRTDNLSVILHTETMLTEFLFTGQQSWMCEQRFGQIWRRARFVLQLRRPSLYHVSTWSQCWVFPNDEQNVKTINLDSVFLLFLVSKAHVYKKKHTLYCETNNESLFCTDQEH